MGRRFYQRKASGFSGERLSEAAESILELLEDTLSDSKKEIFKNSREASLMLTHYFKKHPYALASSGLIAGGLITYLLSKCHHHDHSQCAHHHNNSSKDDVGSQVDYMVKSIFEDFKVHSSEICDAVVSNYMKKKPLQTAGVALAATLIMNLLSRR